MRSTPLAYPGCVRPRRPTTARWSMCSICSCFTTWQAAGRVRRRPGSAVPALPGRDARFVAFGVGQDPEGGRRTVGDEYPARGERGLDPAGRLVMRDRDVEVDPVTLRARLAHLLEPDRRALSERVDQRGLRSRLAGLVAVAHHGLPKWTDRGDVQPVDRDLKDLHRPHPATDSGVGVQPDLARRL